MIYARFLTVTIATLACAQTVSGEVKCQENMLELQTNPKYLEYSQALADKIGECADVLKCDLSELEKMCKDIAVYSVLNVVTTCDGVSVDSQTPQCYPESCPIDDILMDIENQFKIPGQDCRIEIDIDDKTPDDKKHDDKKPGHKKADDGTLDNAMPDNGTLNDGTSSASKFSLDTISVTICGVLLHSLAEAMM